MSDSNLELFTKFKNIFINLDFECKRLLQSEKYNGQVILNKEVWTMKEILEWFIQITTDNLKLINQINHQIQGKYDDETVFIHQEIKNLKADELNLHYLTKGCKHFNEDLIQTLASLRLIDSESEFKKRIPMIYVEMSHYRLMFDHNIYHSILSASKNDIMMHFEDKDHPEYKFVKQRLEYINILEKAEQVKEALEKFGNLSNLSNCALVRTVSKDSSKLKALSEIFWIVYYYLQPKKSLEETKVFQVNPSSELVIAIWNVFERLYPIRLVLKIGLPKVTQRLKIYVPPVYEPITLKEIIEKNTSKTMFDIKADQHMIPQPVNFKRIVDSVQIQNMDNINPSNIQENNQNFQTEWRKYDLFDKSNKQSIKVTILSNIPLIARKTVGKSNDQYQPKKNGPKLVQDIIYHIHGGGWVGLNTLSHEMYTRKWANDLGDIPVFSVEYSNAPENKYPKPLDDCWQVYQFLLNGLEEYFENVKIRKIIIAGDSAGGNMALGICLLALQRGIRRPDGLILSYPALNLRMDFFTPSFINIFKEIIIPFNFLKVSLDSYMDRTNPNVDPNTDPLLSPILFSDKILQQLPPIRMACGDKDLLKDDCIRFLQKLIKLNHNVKLLLYRELTHGYLNLDLPMTLPATKKCGYDCVLFAKQLLSGETLKPVEYFQ
ncbi:hypothetical protein ABPG74_018767 [Tetrahymena malaccensis]